MVWNAAAVKGLHLSQLTTQNSLKFFLTKGLFNFEIKFKSNSKFLILIAFMELAVQIIINEIFTYGKQI